MCIEEPKFKKLYRYISNEQKIITGVFCFYRLRTWSHPTSNAFIEPAKTATFPWPGINPTFKSSPRWFLMILRVCNILYWKELLGFNVIIKVTRLGFYLDVRLANPLVYCVLTFEALKYIINTQCGIVQRIVVYFYFFSNIIAIMDTL